MPEPPTQGQYLPWFSASPGFWKISDVITSLRVSSYLELPWTKVLLRLPRWHRGKGPIYKMQETPVPSLDQEDPWTRKWKPTPFLPGKFHGQRSLEDYSPWGCKESDMDEHTHPRCFLGWEAFSDKTESVPGTWDAPSPSRILWRALWFALMAPPPPPLPNHISLVCSPYTLESLCRGNTKCVSADRMKEWMTFFRLLEQVCHLIRKGTRRLTPWLTDCFNFYQVINSLLYSFLNCKEG